MQQNITCQVNNYNIQGVLQNPNSKKIVILTHGFTGNMKGPDKIYQQLADKLAEKGIASLRFNCRGTPPSEMKFSDMTMTTEVEDLKQIINFVKSKGYEKICLLGESLGGPVSVQAYDAEIDAIVLWYSEFDCSHTYDFLFTQNKQEELKKTGVIACEGYEVGKKFLETIRTINLYPAIEDISCPILFLHGDKDEEVPFEQSIKAHQLANEPKEIHIIKGANHCFRNEQEKVIDLTVQFLYKHF